MGTLPDVGLGFLQSVVMAFSGIGNFFEFLNWGFDIGEFHISALLFLNVSALVGLIGSILILHILHLVNVFS